MGGVLVLSMLVAKKTQLTHQQKTLPQQHQKRERQLSLKIAAPLPTTPWESVAVGNNCSWEKIVHRGSIVWTTMSSLVKKKLVCMMAVLYSAQTMSFCLWTLD